MKVEHAKRLDEQDHRSLVLWAADCAEHVLPCFEENDSEDDRPRKAIEAGRAWARGELAMSKAREAAFAAHAAARDANHAAARAAARAAGHAAATAHVAGHARHAAAYAVTAAHAAQFGLSARLFTRNLNRALDYVQQIEAGLVRVNGKTAGVEPQAPFGGM